MHAVLPKWRNGYGRRDPVAFLSTEPHPLLLLNKDCDRLLGRPSNRSNPPRIAAKAASPSASDTLRIPSLAFAFLATAVSSYPQPPPPRPLVSRVARPGTRFLHSMAVLASSMVAMWEILMNKSCIILGVSVSMMMIQTDSIVQHRPVIDRRHDAQHH